MLLGLSDSQNHGKSGEWHWGHIGEFHADPPTNVEGAPRSKSIIMTVINEGRFSGCGSLSPSPTEDSGSDRILQKRTVSSSLKGGPYCATEACWQPPRSGPLTARPDGMRIRAEFKKILERVAACFPCPALTWVPEGPGLQYWKATFIQLLFAERMTRLMLLCKSGAGMSDSFPFSYLSSAEWRLIGESPILGFVEGTCSLTSDNTDKATGKCCIPTNTNVSGKHDREQFQPVFSPFINALRLLALAPALDCCRVTFSQAYRRSIEVPSTQRRSASYKERLCWVQSGLHAVALTLPAASWETGVGFCQPFSAARCDSVKQPRHHAITL
ncbi:unnamed protein product [Leuciscus chuanchicus]